MLSAALYDIRVDQLFERMRRFHAALSSAGIPYRIVGGMAIFIHVARVEEMNARLTNDVDAAIKRSDLPRVVAIAERFGFRFRHAAGLNMLLDENSRGARAAVHLVFLSEKVQAEDEEPVPASEPIQTADGVLIAPVSDLVHMKLTSFRLKDKVHIQDMDSVGLITPEIEADLSPLFRERLAEVRATE
jgi:hypothetical protein